MKLFADIFPVILFFIAFKFFGIFTATAVAMGASVLQVLIHWFRHKTVAPMQIITMVLIITLGGATLVFHNEVFIKWKPTAINWIFAIVFLGSHFIGEKPLIQKLLNQAVELPQSVWTKLSAGWIGFFIIMGAANLFVAYHYDDNTWVNFKLFGVLGLTLVFVVLQALYLTRYIEDK